MTQMTADRGLAEMRRFVTSDECYFTVKRPRIREFLDRRADDDSLDMRRNAAGFIYLQLSFDPRRTKPALRIHFWPDDEVRPPARPHNHSCRIDSLILCGAMTNLSYRVEEHEDGDRFLTRAFCREDVCEQPSGARRAKLTCSAERLLAPGDRYEIAFPDYHSSVIEQGQFTATMVVMSDFMTRGCFVLAGAPSDEDEVHAKEAIGPARRRELIERLLDRL